MLSLKHTDLKQYMYEHKEMLKNETVGKSKCK